MKRFGNGCLVVEQPAVKAHRFLGALQFCLVCWFWRTRYCFDLFRRWLNPLRAHFVVQELHFVYTKYALFSVGFKARLLQMLQNCFQSI